MRKSRGNEQLFVWGEIRATENKSGKAEEMIELHPYREICRGRNWESKTVRKGGEGVEKGWESDRNGNGKKYLVK